MFPCRPTSALLFGTAAAALALAPARAEAQLAAPPQPTNWRIGATAVGPTARVLVIGAHPDDEDNALIAWLSLGRHVETAYLSLTRGENGVNLMGRERESLLGMVRTAEVLAERQHDGAHQYFTRAYDFGFARNDSVAYAGWPRDSVLRDVVTVLRAFRPQVVIALFGDDSSNHDGQHQAAGELARAAVALAGDTLRMPAAATSLFGAWQPGALYRLVDSAEVGDLAIDVGALDREGGRSYAELGAEIRKLQRTQPAPLAPPVGAVFRYLRREADATLAEGDAPTIAQTAAQPAALFAGIDTGWTRFAAAEPLDAARLAVDSIAPALAALANETVHGSRDDVTAQLSTVVRLTSRARQEVACGEPSASRCSPARADLALALATTHDRATQALLDASGIVIDATSARETVATGDTVRVSVAVHNGGTRPVDVTRVAVEGPVGAGFERTDTTSVAPDSTVRFSGLVHVSSVAYAWWMTKGLIDGTWLYAEPISRIVPVNVALATGEDRVAATNALVRLRVAGTELTAPPTRVVGRATTDLRGDMRHPLAGVPGTNLLLEQSREYARASVPFERLERVWIGSAKSREDTVLVEIDLPTGLTTDSATRRVVLPPFGHRTIFYRVHGVWRVGASKFNVVATPNAKTSPIVGRGDQKRLSSAGVTSGLVSFEYPHIPTQRLYTKATDSVEAVYVKLPPALRVAYVRASHDDDLDGRIAELGVRIFPVDPSQLAVADLSWYSTILIGPNAFATIDALAANAPALRQFAERGGTVVVLEGRDELAAPGILPYPIAFDSTRPVTVFDAKRSVAATKPTSPLLAWPNRLAAADFDGWVALRAHELPSTFDARYAPVIEMADDAGQTTSAAILAARVGKGAFIYTGLSLDRQLLARNPGAARLLVNLLAAGLRVAK